MLDSKTRCLEYCRKEVIYKKFKYIDYSAKFESQKCTYTRPSGSYFDIPYLHALLAPFLATFSSKGLIGNKMVVSVSAIVPVFFGPMVNLFSPDKIINFFPRAANKFNNKNSFNRLNNTVSKIM